MQVQVLAPLIVIFLFQFTLLNPLEKLFISTYTDSPTILRPSDECKGNMSLNCLGMPSGHSETAAALFTLLYKYNFLSLPVSAILILFTGLQRIVANRHTPLQVLIGWGIGFVYAALYQFGMGRKPNWRGPLIGFSIAVLFSIVLALRVNTLVHGPIPSWVDSSLYPIIKKKQNASILNKYLYTLVPLITPSFTVFCSWNRLEAKLDTLLDIIKNKGIAFDAIVGIKSGGAILASYLHSKLPSVPTYYLKLKRIEKNKRESNLLTDAYARYVAKSAEYTFKVEEGIEDKLEGKTVLLIDETIETGDTVVFAKHYLESEKQANKVVITTLSISNKPNRKNPIDAITIPKNEDVTIWPWGYDN